MAITSEEYRKLSKVDQQNHWFELRRTVNAQMDENAGVIENFRAKMQSFFEGAVEAQGKNEFERRPCISLRLIMEGEPAGKLILIPRWDRKCVGILEQMQRRKKPYHSADCTVTNCEMMIEEEGRGKHKGTTRLMKAFSLNIGSRNHGSNLIRLTAVEDFQRVLVTMRDFVEDFHKVLSRSRQNCCICGRPLKDELSRCRGIGPECIKTAPMVWFDKTENSLLFA